MIVSINRILTALEGRIFMYGLSLCVVFRLIRSVNEFSSGQSDVILMIGVGYFVVLMLMLTALKRYKTFCFVLLHALFLFNAIYTWPTSGGYQGITPYAIVAMISFAIFSSHGLLLGITLSLYALTTICLVQGYAGISTYDEPEVITQLNFLVCTFILLRLCVYAKNRFFAYGEYVQSINKKLDASAAILNGQAQQIKAQRDRLLSVRKDLEEKIAMKHLEKEQKQAMMSKYAYVNAHRVRGPLARILGLIALIEREKLSHESKRHLQEIKTDALEVDEVVRKIGEVLSD